MVYAVLVVEGHRCRMYIVRSCSRTQFDTINMSLRRSSRVLTCSWEKDWGNARRKKSERGVNWAKEIMKHVVNYVCQELRVLQPLHITLIFFPLLQNAKRYYLPSNLRLVDRNSRRRNQWKTARMWSEYLHLLKLSHRKWIRLNFVEIKSLYDLCDKSSAHADKHLKVIIPLEVVEQFGKVKTAKWAKKKNRANYGNFGKSTTHLRPRLACAFAHSPTMNK